MNFALDKSLHRERDGAGEFLPTPEAFSNRVGPYGGWIAALLTRLILDAGPHGDLLQINISYLAGCTGRIDGRTKLLRRNRTTEFWTAEIFNADAPVAHAVATFGVRRPSIQLGDMPAPLPAPPPESLPVRPLFPGAPEFLKRYDVRQFEGAAFQKNPDTRSRAYVRDADQRPLDVVGLIAHADAPMPRTFLLTGAPQFMTATLSMNVYLHASPAAIAAVNDDFILVEAEARAGHDGIHDQAARLWRRDGHLLATTEQLVWFKALDRSHPA